MTFKEPLNLKSIQTDITIKIGNNKMLESKTKSLKISNTNNQYTVAFSEGELLNKLNWLRLTFKEVKNRLSEASLEERNHLLGLLQNTEVCFNETKVILEELSYVIKPIE